MSEHCGDKCRHYFSVRIFNTVTGFTAMMRNQNRSRVTSHISFLLNIQGNDKPFGRRELFLIVFHCSGESLCSHLVCSGVKWVYYTVPACINEPSGFVLKAAVPELAPVAPD